MSSTLSSDLSKMTYYSMSLHSTVKRNLLSHCRKLQEGGGGGGGGLKGRDLKELIWDMSVHHIQLVIARGPIYIPAIRDGV